MNRIGLVVATCLSIIWLGVIVADQAWWQLVAWVIFVPIGIGAWLLPSRLARRGRDVP